MNLSIPSVSLMYMEYQGPASYNRFSVCQLILKHTLTIKL